MTTWFQRKGLVVGLALTTGMALIFVTTWLTTDRRLNGRVEEIRRVIEAELPTGTAADSVLAFLEYRRAEHSKYIAKDRTIYAAFRNVVMQFPVSWGIFVRFEFDQDNRLKSYQVDTTGDGP